MSTDVMKSVCNGNTDVEDIRGEYRHRQLALYVVLHPTQLLGNVPSPKETAQGVPLLAIRDELQGLLDAVR